MFDIEEIQKILPHRFPFVMVDRVLELEPGKKILAIKNVSINEEFFSGHFPERPIMPGVLIVEAMAQSGIILLYSKAHLENKKISYYLGSVKIRFFHPVLPGDQLKITVEPLKLISNAGIVSASAYVLDKKVASGEISFVAKEER